MFSKTTSLAAIALLLTLAACKKEETIIAPTPTVDPQALLTSGAWKKTGEVIAGVDIFKNNQACELDNTFAYSADGKLIMDEGATKCDPTDIQTETGSWAFVGADKKKLIITQGLIAITTDIIEINATTMKWSFTNPFDNVLTVQTFSK
jgi:hypothetical protein